MLVQLGVMWLQELTLLVCGLSCTVMDMQEQLVSVPVPSLSH